MKRVFPIPCLLLLGACTDPFGTWPGDLDEWRAAQGGTADTEADTDTDADADSDTDAVADAVAESDADSEAVCDADTDADTDADADADCKTGEISEHEGISMALVCADSFTMGSPSSELGHDEEENDHEVTLTGGYYIGVTEVTQGEFESFMEYAPFAYSGCADCPAESINWYEAAAFANAVSTAAGLDPCYDCSGKKSVVTCELDSDYPTPYDCVGYRLPTEAEWEFAARAGTESAFSNGGNLVEGTQAECSDVTLDNKTLLGDIAVYCGNDPGQTAEVAGKAPNSWGLYDVHGNVWEWCQDWYDSYGGDEKDPWGPAKGDKRVGRGGAWGNFPMLLRSANRNDFGADGTADNVGLRLARSK